MVTVVGQGKKTTFEATCYGCAAILHFVREDVKRVTDYGGGTDPCITCPSCNTTFIISYGKRVQ